jgi:hypothetical protein
MSCRNLQLFPQDAAYLGSARNQAKTSHDDMTSMIIIVIIVIVIIINRLTCTS